MNEQHEQAGQAGHTPGPWKANTYCEHPSMRRGKFIYSPGHTLEIAKVQFYGEYAPSISDEEKEANTQLIVAAPDLLSACEMAYSYLEAEPKWHKLADLLAQAISKAKA